MVRNIKLICNKYLFLLLIFVTGITLLILELVSTRVFAAYFGTTILISSSILSVVLFAISVGSYIGGRITDKWGSPFLFFLLMTFSALGIFLLQLGTVFLLPQISHNFPVLHGSLLAAILLLFLPIVFLGMLVPLCVRLQRSRLKKSGIGSVVGIVLFWLMCGSFIGNLQTELYLIPTFGIKQIIFTVGTVLLSIGLLGVLLSRQKNTAGMKIFVMLVILPFLHFALLSLNTEPQRTPPVYSQSGLYTNITVFDGEMNYQKTRFLKQDTDTSNAMYLTSTDLVEDYTKYYAVYKLVNKRIQNALVIGGGAYAIPKALLAGDTTVTVDVTEIEPDMYGIGKKYFNVPDEARLRNHVEDGRRFLQQTDTKYELIVSDAFHHSIPAHMATQEFFSLTRDKLTSNGIFVANIIGSLSEKRPSFLFSEMKTFRSIFPNSYFFAAVSPHFPDSQHIIMVGYNAPDGRDLLSVDTEDDFLSQLDEYRIEPADYHLEEYPVFTDNFAPVEYYLSKDLLVQSD